MLVDEQQFPIIIQELGQSNESLDQDVENLQKWMKSQPHFPEILEPRTIKNFLVLNKFSVEKTKQKIDAYFTVKTELDDIFSDFDPKLPHMREVREIIYFVPFPKLLDHRRIFYFKVRNPSLGEKLDPCNILRHKMNITEIRLRNDVMFEEYFIIDCQNLPLSFYFKITPTVIFKAMIIIYEKVYSCRLKGFYVINCPPIAEKLVALAKKVMKPKLAERMKFYTDCSVLNRELPEEYVPEDYGGTGPSLEKLNEMLECQFQQHEELFAHLKTLKVDENVRPASLKNDDLFGCYGNFKKLNVD